MDEMVNVFNEVQLCDRRGLHKSVNILKGFLKVNANFDDDFLDIIAIFLFNAKKSDLSLFVLFINTFFEKLSSKERKIMNHLYEFLVQLLVSDIKNVRRNALTLLRLVPFEDVKNNELVVLTVCTMLFDKDNEVTKEAIKYVANWQEFKFNKKSCVYNILMDLIRHNPYPAIRREALRYIVINEKTINCVVEKVSDSDYTVRKVFYEDIFDKLNLKQLKNENYEFLIDRVFMEREFDYKKDLIDKINQVFDLENNLYQFLETYQIDSLKPVINVIFSRLSVNINYFPKSYVEAVVLSLYTEYIAKNVGLDEVKLPELSKYIFHLEELMQNEIYFEIDVFPYCIEVLSYYDIFDKKDRNNVTNFLNNIIEKSNKENEYNAIFKVFSKIISSGEFIYNLINNIKADNIRVILMVKNFLRYYKDDIFICKKVINDIIMPLESVPKTCESLLYYIDYHRNTDYDMFFIKNGNLNELVDYYIMVKSNNVLIRIKELIETGIQNDDENIITPISKLYLISANVKNIYLSFILIKFYKEMSDNQKQYIIVFLNEIFSIKPDLLIESFNNVFISISDKKIFTNHTLSWIKMSADNIKVQQNLFYKIVCLLLVEKMSKLDSAILLGLLEQIEINSSWDLIMIKRILYCCTVLLRKSENNNGLNGVIGRLLGVDDGEPLDASTIAALKQEISGTDNLK